MEKLTMIRIEDINPHPDNPRKDLGDLEELTESIKKNGIMQNLTVIPAGEPGKYTALIGHRRLAAAKAAGLNEIPAKVVEGLSHREQVGIMLEENMQRTDLTVPEQAYGFQMMLDLGETEASIAEKTGFSRSTIRHRLQIARLNKKVLEKQWQNNEFQLTLTDLIALEKIKGIKDRDHLLRTARDSKDLRYKIDLFLRNQAKEENARTLIEMLEKMGIHKMSEDQLKQRYTSKWECCTAIPLEEDPPEKLKIEHMEDTAKTFYVPVEKYDRSLWVYKMASDNKSKSAVELKREEEERKRKALVKLHAVHKNNRRIFIEGILNGTYGEPANANKAMEDLIEVAIELGTRLYTDNIGEWITKKRTYSQTPEQKEMVLEKLQAMNSLEKLLVEVDYAARERDIVNWDGRFEKDVGSALDGYHEILTEQWGFTIDDENIRMMLDGTHPNYKKGKK